MHRTNQALNELYRNLLITTPQTVSMEIPPDLGTGQITQTETKQGIVLSDWRMNYLSDMNVQGTNSPEYIQIIFCVGEGISWGTTNERYSVNIQKGESCIYNGCGKTESICYSQKRGFYFKSLKIPMRYFSSLLSDYFDNKELQSCEKKLFTGFSKVKITPSMERILAETRDFAHYHGGLGHLYLDGRISELLAVYLSEVLEMDMLSNNNALISATDRASLMEAKRIIDSQIAFAPSCQELSRLVHLSVTKLTKGFSQIFGMPVHTYIIDRRLSCAARLLLESDLNISEIAMAVGYAKPSNFAAAFRKKYGVVPKGYRKSQILDS